MDGNTITRECKTVQNHESKEERRRSFEIAAKLKHQIPRIILDSYIEGKPKGRESHDNKMRVIKRCGDFFVKKLMDGIPGADESRCIIRLMKKGEPMIAMAFLMEIINALAKKEDCSYIEGVYLATMVSGIVKEVSTHHKIGIDLAFMVPAPTMDRLERISASLPPKIRQELDGMFYTS